jgi:uncharacterized protein YcbK (DUF882 family)
MRYFKYREFACKCPYPDCKADGTGIDKTLAAKLDAIREKYGKPMVVTSGCRCPEWNKACGGSIRSYHQPFQGFRAVDIACTVSTDRYNLIRYAIEVGGLSIGINKPRYHL